jgi:hypothetical protein
MYILLLMWLLDIVQCNIEVQWFLFVDDKHVEILSYVGWYSSMKSIMSFIFGFMASITTKYFKVVNI